MRTEKLNQPWFKSIELLDRDPVDPIQMESDRIQNQLKRVQLLKKVREKGTDGDGKTTQREGERIHEVDFDFDEGDQLDKRIQMLQQKVLIAPEFEGLWAGDNNGDFDPEDDAALEKVAFKHNNLFFVY